MANEKLARVYEKLAVNSPEFSSKAFRLKDCSTVLIFDDNGSGQKVLASANSCRVRLCPLCSWRRALRVFRNTMSIIATMSACGRCRTASASVPFADAPASIPPTEKVTGGQGGPDGSFETASASKEPYSFLLLTLTVRNCSGSELSTTLDLMMQAWHRMIERQAFKKAVKGWYRGMEVTRNDDRSSEWYNTYHPHFHCLLAVNPSYFKSRNYLKKSRWVELWREALGASYSPSVDIRTVKVDDRKDMVSAVSEAAKYIVKENDYLVTGDLSLSASIVRVLDKALARRRLVAYGGVMKEWHKRLNLSDELNDDECAANGQRLTGEIGKEVYFWHTGIKQYIRKEVEK